MRAFADAAHVQERVTREVGSVRLLLGLVGEGVCARVRGFV